MALDPIVNFFRSTIATLPVASGGTSIVLQTGDGNKLPAPAIDGAFNLTIYNADDPFVAPEIVRVTARATDTLTVTRAQEGTSATNKTAGSTWNVELTPTAKTIQDIDSAKLDVAGGTLTGDLTIPDKIIHSGDTNTAIRFPADDTVTVETAGSEAFRVDSSQNVGINTTQGISKLQVNNLADATSFFSLTGGDAIVAGNSVTVSKTQRGILHIDNNQRNVQGRNASLTFGLGGSQFLDTYYVVGGAIRTEITGTANLAINPAMIFSVLNGSSNTGTLDDMLTIKHTGDIGIGTTSPATKLDVNGSIRASNDIIAPNLPDRFNNPLQSLTLTGDAVNAIDGCLNFGSLSGSSKWYGGVLAPNGKIYGIPLNSTTVLEIDPVAQTATTFGSLSGSAKWRGGVLAPNGKIYGIPTNSTTVLEIDPVAQTATTFGSLSGSAKWIGGVLAPNGKIYGIPLNSTTVLEIDPVAQTATTFGSLSGSSKWYGGVLAPNGKIYGIPYSSTTVLEIDPVAQTATTFGSLSGSAEWIGGVLAPNGKIYGIPYNSTTVLEIDPVAQTATTFGSLSGSGKWYGGVLAPNGKIYGIPYDSTTVLEIDPVAQTTTTFGSLAGSLKWIGGVLAPNGKIYGIPYNSTTVLEISNGAYGNNWWALSAYTNKF